MNITIMINRFLPLLLMLLLSFVSVAQNEESTINEIMDEWHNAATTGDFETYFNILDDSARFLGTDATENWPKDEFAAFSKKYFERGKAWEFVAIERNIYFDNTKRIAWFDEILNTWMGLCRGSGVLTQVDQNDWKLNHYVLSILIPNDDVQEVLQVKNSFDSTYFKNREIEPISRD